MKKVFELLLNTSEYTKILIIIFIVFGISVLLCSAFAFYFAGYSNNFYALKELSFELIKASRACIVIIFCAVLIASQIDKK